MALLRDRWYALQVRVNREWVVERSLQNRGYAVLVPAARATSQWSDRVKHAPRPLFPGYVLCRFDPTLLTRMVDCPAVIRIVGFGGEPVPIDDVELESIRIVSQANCEASACPYLQQGQPVRLCSGPLAGVTGIVLRQKNETRVVIQATLLQRAVSVLVTRDAIEPVSVPLAV
jgi:transcription antitermination factor NusG